MALLSVHLSRFGDGPGVYCQCHGNKVSLTPDKSGLGGLVREPWPSTKRIGARQSKRGPFTVKEPTGNDFYRAALQPRCRTRERHGFLVKAP